MQTKDIVTLVISGLAFLVALGSILYTVIWGRHEERRALRNLLTDTLKEIISVSVELGKHQPRTPDNADIIAMLNQQYMMLLGQATYLVRKIKSMVTPIEYNTLAGACVYVGLTDLAETYYQTSIATSPDDYNISLTTSSYAHFLFIQDQSIEGKKQYEAALSLLEKTNSNQSHLTRGRLYVVWAKDELNYAQKPEKADKRFTDAQAEFEKITVELLKQHELGYLKEEEARASQPLTQPPPLNVSPLPPTP